MSTTLRPIFDGGWVTCPFGCGTVMMYEGEPSYDNPTVKDMERHIEEEAAQRIRGGGR